MRRFSIVISIMLLFSSLVQAEDLDKILEKGFIEFAVYENFPPFSYKAENGRLKGIDVDIGKAIAKKLDVQVGFRPSLADESLEDDLRNLVWKGHYLAGAPADVMLHVPYDPNFARDNDKVAFVQPYYKELIAFAINPYRIRSAKNLEVFTREPIGVETASMADAYLLGAYNGELRDNVKHYMTISEAAKAMVDEEISAIMAVRSELEYNLSKYEHDFLITKLPTPGLYVDGWELGAAVKSSSTALAKKLNTIIGELKQSGEIEKIFKSYGLNFKEAESTELISNRETVAEKE